MINLLTLGGIVSGLSIDQLVLDRDRYAAMRPEERKRMVAIRRSRRVQVGARVALEFENEETLRYQVQEMIFAEGITKESAAAEEIAIYSRLVPTAGSVSATLFLEFGDVDTVKAELDGLTGIQHMITLQVGDTTITGIDVPPPDEANDKQTYSVHFIRFELDDEQRQGLANLTVPVQLSVSHAKYQASAPLPADLRAQLIADLDVSR